MASSDMVVMICEHVQQSLLVHKCVVYRDVPGPQRYLQKSAMHIQNE